jgi:NAD(P)-dependent dehydrogenase (short-subunit alcohol dehydrogenase family)
MGTVQSRIPVAFVTGATGTIGRAVVDRLLRENWAVMMFSRSRDSLVSARYELQNKYPMTIVRIFDGDVQYEQDVSKALKIITDAGGPVDLLVTCHAAPPMIKPSEDIGYVDFMTVINSDLVGTFNVNQIIGRQMLKNGGGCIVNLSSIHSIASYPQRSSYAASKTGVVGFSRVLAIEWASRNVRVNCISPWQVRGPRTKNSNGHQISDVIKRSPSGKLIEPSDISETVMYLWNTPGMTGQNIVLDGGVLSSAWYMPFGDQ